MSRKNRTYKNRKGGFLEKRLNSLWQGKTAKTYCCADKRSNGDILGSGSNVGSKCTRSYTGQCLPGYGTGNNYKFRCFDSKFDDNSEISTINEKDNNKCEYISGAVSKVGKTAAATAYGTGTVIKTASKNTLPIAFAMLTSPFNGGGKKRKSRSTRKSKKNKKQHRK